MPATPTCSASSGVRKVGRTAPAQAACLARAEAMSRAVTALRRNPMFLAFWATCRQGLSMLGAASTWQILEQCAPFGQPLQGGLEGGASMLQTNCDF